MARYFKDVQTHTGEVSDGARQLAADLGIDAQWVNDLLASRRHHFPFKAMP